MISRLADQKWPELAGLGPLVVLPLGSCEQHGPQLPLDTDHAAAEAVARRAAALLADNSGLLVAPGQPYVASGEHEGSLAPCPSGTSRCTLLMVELGRSVLRWADRLVVVNGHGGNLPSMPAAIGTLPREGRDPAWWPCLPRSADLHAGHAETSMMLRLRSAEVDVERADWRTLLDVDVTGVLNLARAAVPALLRSPRPRRGRFVAWASGAAHHGLWRLGGYCVAEHAVLGPVRALACDLQGTGVNAVAVSPRSARTDMLQATASLCQLTDAEQLVDHQLVLRLLEPEEVASIVACACSPEASAVTGSVLYADGGFG